MRKIDCAFRNWAALTVLIVFTLGVALTWSSGGIHAQTPLENSIRITDLENRDKEQAASGATATVLLADHDRRLSVVETKESADSKQLEEITGYIKWLVMGVFGLLGMKTWERIGGIKGRRYQGAASS